MVSKEIMWAYIYSVKILQVYIIPSVRQCCSKCVVSKEIKLAYFYSVKILHYTIFHLCVSAEVSVVSKKITWAYFDSVKILQV